MNYLLAFVFPPIAVLLAGKPFQAILSLVLTFCGYFPGVLHAILVVHGAKQDKQHKEVLRALERKAS